MSNGAFALSSDHQRYVDDQVASGAYPDAGAVVADAIERMADAESDAAKLARLNAKLARAAEGLDRGEGTTVSDLDAHFDEIMAEVVRR